jgi:NADH-quinone oxidoreductase subunit L
LTTFYMFRLWYLTFHGRSRVEKEVAAHIHEAPPSMLLPMGLLAIASSIGGFIQLPMFPKFAEWLEPVFGQFVGKYFAPNVHNADVDFQWGAFALVLALIAGGWFVARDMYQLGPRPRLKGRLVPVQTFLLEKWYFDKLYHALFERPAYWIAETSWRWLDRGVIDNLVNSVARGVRNAGDDLRPVESGYVRTYALSLMVGVVLVLLLAVGQR